MGSAHVGNSCVSTQGGVSGNNVVSDSRGGASMVTWGSAAEAVAASTASSVTSRTVGNCMLSSAETLDILCNLKFKIEYTLDTP